MKTKQKQQKFAICSLGCVQHYYRQWCFWIDAENRSPKLISNRKDWQTARCVFPKVLVFARYFWSWKLESKFKVILNTNSFAPGSRCAFATQGSGPDTQTYISSSPVVFDKVDLNICNGYDVNTGTKHIALKNIRIKLIHLFIIVHLAGG